MDNGIGDMPLYEVKQLEQRIRTDGLPCQCWGSVVGTPMLFDALIDMLRAKTGGYVRIDTTSTSKTVEHGSSTEVKPGVVRTYRCRECGDRIEGTFEQTDQSETTFDDSPTEERQTND